jgi:hypothetical protein
MAHLNYAKATCNHILNPNKEGPVFGHWFNCMSAQGFVWVDDAPAQIAARERAAQDAQMRAAQAIQDAQVRALGQAIGQTVTNLGNEMSQPPTHCHPHTLQLGC